LSYQGEETSTDGRTESEKKKKGGKKFGGRPTEEKMRKTTHLKLRAGGLNPGPF